MAESFYSYPKRNGKTVANNLIISATQASSIKLIAEMAQKADATLEMDL
jgi:hypothetical protein